MKIRKLASFLAQPDGTLTGVTSMLGMGILGNVLAGIAQVVLNNAVKEVMGIFVGSLPIGVTSDSIITDFTDETKMMSAGAVLACGDAHPMQYFWGDKKSSNLSR